MFPLPEENHWVSRARDRLFAHPDWRRLLRVFADRMPARRVMIDKYLVRRVADAVPGRAGAHANLRRRTSRYYFSYDTYFGDEEKAAPREALEPSPELLDTFWGYYFATGPLSPGRAHRRHAGLVERRRQRRNAHARQHGEIHARGNASRD